MRCIRLVLNGTRRRSSEGWAEDGAAQQECEDGRAHADLTVQMFERSDVI